MPNPSENWLLRAKADLTPAIIAKAIAKRLKKLGVGSRHRRRAWTSGWRSSTRASANWPRSRPTPANARRGSARGCPHNTSTRVPEGSRAVAGIGCHYMAVWMDRSTATFTQMGGEGVPWVGQAPFTNEKHIFANLGDGTYFHSGLLAIRQSIAAGVNITYKILYNDAVAMTGGQQVGERPEGHSVTQIMKSVLAEGATQAGDRDRRAREVRRRRAGGRRHRAPPRRARPHPARVPRAQGTTVIIYDQTCATEKRRRRKRGKLADPEKRVVINELVCEGCGDCCVQSNCLRVEPVETEFGRKRRINQNTCNKDYSLREGLLPELRHHRRRAVEEAEEGSRKGAADAAGGARTGAAAGRKAWGIVVGGVGGTGVITIGQLLGMAAHIEGKGVVTQDAGGLAQKGGATWSHIQIANRAEAIHTTKVDTAKADLVIACDSYRRRDQVHDDGDAARPHLRGAEQPRHADGGVCQEPRLAVPGRQLRNASALSVGADCRCVRRRTGGGANWSATRSTPTRCCWAMRGRRAACR